MVRPSDYSGWYYQRHFSVAQNDEEQYLIESCLHNCIVSKWRVRDCVLYY